jgi:SAM-dependent methyltransferase
MHQPESIQRQRDWESRYRTGATGWDRGGVSPALAGWLARDELPQGRVLVPGCGHGYEVLALAEAGHYVTAVDIAAPAVMSLMGQLTDAGLHAKVIQADLLNWTPAEPFDAIYEQTCLCALHPEQWQAYAERLAGWLVPGGKLFALFMQTGRVGGPPYHCEMADMRELFPDSLWIWPEQSSTEVAHPNGLHELAHVLIRRGGDDQPAV